MSDKKTEQAFYILPNNPFFKVVVDKDNILEKHPEVLEKLKNGELKSLSFELKKGGDEKIFSARINQSDRILFYIDRGMLVVAEEILNHDYSKSKILKKGGLYSHCQSFKTIYDELYQKALTALSPKDRETLEKHAKQFERLMVLNEVFFFLSEEQDKVIKSTSTAGLVIGCAGAGKTTIAQIILEQWAQMLLEMSSNNNNNQPVKKVLYVTKSKRLANYVKPLMMDFPNIEVKTYDELFGEKAVFIKQEGFEAWIKQFKNNNKSKLSYLKSFDATKCRAMFRLIAGIENPIKPYKNDERIIALKLHDIEPKELDFWFAALESYKFYLQQCKLIDTDLSSLPVKPGTYHSLVVDETQGLSTKAIEELNKLKSPEHGRCFYCLSNSQNSDDAVNKINFIKKIASINEDNVFPLDGSFRTPQLVTMAIKVFQNINKQTTGGDIDNYESIKSHHPDNGTVLWYEDVNTYINSFNPVFNNNNQVTAKREDLIPSHAVVIAHEDNIEELLKDDAFKKLTILTPAQAKGLEFPYVIVYNPFSHPNFHEANKDFDETKIKKVQFKTKNLKNIEAWFAQNDNMVAISRSSQTVVFLQTKYPQSQKLIDYAKKEILPLTNISQKQEKIEQVIPLKLTFNELLLRQLNILRGLEENTKISNLMSNFKNQLDMTIMEQSFKVFIQYIQDLSDSDFKTFQKKCDTILQSDFKIEYLNITSPKQEIKIVTTKTLKVNQVLNDKKDYQLLVKYIKDKEVASFSKLLESNPALLTKMIEPLKSSLLLLSLQYKADKIFEYLMALPNINVIINANNNNDITPLICAAQSGSLKQVQQLINAGGDPLRLYKGEDHIFAIILKRQDINNDDVINFLIEEQKNKNNRPLAIKEITGFAPILYVAQTGSLKQLQEFIAAGASPLTLKLNQENNNNIWSSILKRKVHTTQDKINFINSHKEFLINSIYFGTIIEEAKKDPGIYEVVEPLIKEADIRLNNLMKKIEDSQEIFTDLSAKNYGFNLALNGEYSKGLLLHAIKKGDLKNVMALIIIFKKLYSEADLDITQQLTYQYSQPNKEIAVISLLVQKDCASITEPIKKLLLKEKIFYMRDFGDSSERYFKCNIFFQRAISTNDIQIIPTTAAQGIFSGYDKKSDNDSKHDEMVISPKNN